MYVKKAERVGETTSYTAQHTFRDFDLSEKLQQNILAKGYATPTPIQDEAIKPILQGHDVIGLANTGTGKTAAFLIPLIQKMQTKRGQKTLIVVPTRELAVQILDEWKGFTKDMFMYAVLCIGGMSLYRQSQELRRDHDCVIATPGRLKDLENQRKIRLHEYSTIVLDEVDRMMDMGFIRDVQLIISKLPQVRQSLFFSATMPQEIRSLASSFLRSPITVSVKTHETARAVEQDIVRLKGRMKSDVLEDLLSQQGFDKVIVFGRTKWGMEKLARILDGRGFRVAAIHGNKSQGQRQRALEDFKRGRVTALLATDVASRGLDIQDVTHVINYDEPATYDDYVHRIGRTGRANKSGVALTFID
jgi:superfamily II DNA/RNA helicase